MLFQFRGEKMEANSDAIALVKFQPVSDETRTQTRVWCISPHQADHLEKMTLLIRKTVEPSG